MQIILLAVAVGLIGGAAVGFQSPLASLIGQRLGSWESIFIIHLGGTIASGAYLLLNGGGNLNSWRSVPWYALGAGVLGLLVVGSNNFSMPRLGMAGTIAIFITAQLSISLVLDHFELLGSTGHPITLIRLAGVAAMAIGVWLILRP